MNKALKLKSISSSEVELNTWHPTENEDVFICLDIEVGFADEESGVNLFYVTLATPEALRRHCNPPVLVKNRTIVISDYSYDAVRDAVLEILSKCTRDSWNDSCVALQRYFQWEFEDYSTE